MHFLKATLTLTGSLLALAAAAPAMAQGEDKAAAAEASSAIGDIIVTAQFREQNLQDTPIAITAVNAEMLEARSQTDISKVADQAPNVTLKQSAAAFGPAMGASIRGIGQYDFNPAVEPGVGMYVDDVYYATLTGSMFDLLDLDRVEILRGPQGTLAGKNSIGGAIKLYSKKPEGDGSGYVSATYGSRNRLDFRASADFSIAKNLFARVSGVYKDQDGHVDRLDYGCVFPTSGIPATQPAGRCKVSEQGGVGYRAMRGMLRYNPYDGLDITIIGDYTKDSRTVAGGVLLNADNANPNVAVNGVPYDNRFICGRYCNYAGFGNPAGTFTANFVNTPGGPVPVPWFVPPDFTVDFPLAAASGDDRSEYEGWGFSGKIEADLNDNLTLESITAYREYDTSWNNDDQMAPTSVAFGKSALDHWFVSQELRLNGKIGDTINFTLGGFYSDQRTTYFALQDIRYAPIPLQFIGDDPVNADTKAGFFNLGWQATDALGVNAGVRYSKETKDYTFFRFIYDGVTPNPFLGALNGVTGSYEGDKWDYRLAVDYRISPEFLVYASTSTGFKGGGIGPRPFNPAQVQSFDPETLTAYEVGFKSDLFDRKLRINAAAFFNKYKDIQLTFLSCPQFGGPGPCALPQNAGDADVKGIELETTIRPVDGLTIDGAASYLDFEYKSVDPAVGAVNPRSPFTPKWKWSIGIQYEAQLGADAGTLTPRFDAAYQSAIFTNAAPSPAGIQELAVINGYTIANARLTWRNADEDLEIAAEVTNVFDKYYFNSTFDLSTGGLGVTTGYPGRPREWAISVKKKF